MRYDNVKLTILFINFINTINQKINSINQKS